MAMCQKDGFDAWDLTRTEALDLLRSPSYTELTIAKGNLMLSSLHTDKLTLRDFLVRTGDEDATRDA